MLSKTIKYSAILLASMTLVASCAKENVSSSEVEQTSTSDSFISTQQDFARILSSALYNEPDLRAFLKDEALKEFDNDYDVFYPYAKNSPVSGDRTFKDILLSYCDDAGTLDRIESEIPKLTILVPDWSWLDKDGFNVNTWDTGSEEVFVGISGEDEGHVLYLNGDGVVDIPDDIVPCSPVVIVKSNERMRVASPATRGSEATFEFVSDVYDGSKNPATRAHTSTINWNYDKSGSSDFVPASELPYKVKRAAEEFSYGNSSVAQRDYIYYGMSRTNTKGVLDKNLKEYVYRFKIDPAKINSMLDYHNSSDSKSDPTFERESQEFKRQKNKLKPEENGIQKYLWSDGSLEIKFIFYLGTYGSNMVATYSEPISVMPSQLWEVTTSEEKRTTHGTVFHYKYTSEMKDLVAKWYYPIDFPVEPFDLANNSTSIWFTIYEEDPSGTSETTVTKTFKYTKNVKSSHSESIDIGFGIDKWSFGLKFTDTEEDSSVTEDGTQSSMVLKVNEGDDHLGEGCLDYMAPIINSGLKYEGGVQGYSLKSIPAAGGQVMVTFIPKNNI